LTLLSCTPFFTASSPELAFRSFEALHPRANTLSGGGSHQEYEIEVLHLTTLADIAQWNVQTFFASRQQVIE
jgi:hypothetical protein